MDPLSSFRAWWPYVGMLVLVPIASLQLLLFRRRGLNWAETYSFGLYMLGQIALIHTVLHVADHFMTMYIPWYLFAIPEALFVAWSVAGLYQDRKPSVLARGLFLFVAYASLAAGVLYLAFNFGVGAIFRV